jgi:hypothetical protein
MKLNTIQDLSHIKWQKESGWLYKGGKKKWLATLKFR